MSCRYCAGCNTRWVDTGCGDAEWHARCPHSCAICQKPMTGRESPDACAGHTRAEHDALMARIRGRAAS